LIRQSGSFRHDRLQLLQLRVDIMNNSSINVLGTGDTLLQLGRPWPSELWPRDCLDKGHYSRRRMATYCGHSNAPAEYALKEDTLQNFSMCVVLTGVGTEMKWSTFYDRFMPLLCRPVVPICSEIRSLAFKTRSVADGLADIV